MESSNNSPTFEQSLSRLQQLVDQLEDGQLTLAQSLAAYEEGIKHLQVCHAALTETERKIEILSGFNAQGEPIARPFDDTASGDQADVARRRCENRRNSKSSAPQDEPPTDRGELDGRRELF